MLQKVKTQDAKFESVTSNISQELRINLKTKEVGHKILIYAYDKSLNLEEGRQFALGFFQEHLGFCEDEIVMVSTNEIPSLD